MNKTIFSYFGFFVCISAFISFYNAGLPMPPYEFYAQIYPSYVSPLRLGRLSIHEITIFIALFLFFLNFYIHKRAELKIDKRLFFFIVLLICLSSLLLVSSILFDARPLLDIFRALRLTVNGVITFLIYAAATKAFGPNIIKYAIFGLISSILINILVSYNIPLENDRFVLHGQNTAVVYCAFGIHFIILHILITNKINLWCISALIVLFFVVIIGDSRTAYAVTFLACYPIYHLIIKKIHLGQINTKFLSGLGVIGLVLFVANLSPIERRILALKEDGFSGDNLRYEMVLDTIEILNAYPMGVGLSGYFEAKHKVYGINKIAKNTYEFEDNPHSTILYYIAAGGYLGGIILLMLFFLTYSILKRTLKFIGENNYYLFLFGSFIVASLSIPYLFNSLLLIIPLGVLSGHVIKNDR
tara:strand:+ start:2322 stop:3566 length:1245 start_codon:yes stop_codon:yes gene_type:complete